jgi:hypothetical protein
LFAAFNKGALASRLWFVAFALSDAAPTASKKIALASLTEPAGL